MCRFNAPSKTASVSSRKNKVERNTLAVGDPLEQAALALGVLGLEGDGVPLDVRILAHGIGGGVVLVVLVHPPLVADAHDDIGQELAQLVIALVRGKDLAVSRLMGQESELGQQQTQCTGHQQLEPAIPEQEKAGNCTCKENRQDGGDANVVSAAALD